MNYRIAVWTLRALPIVLIIGGWLYTTGPGGVSPLLLPPLPKVLSTAASLVHTAVFWRAVGTTMVETLSAWAIAALIGLAVGFGIARSRLRSQVIEPMIAWGYVAPLILFYPVFILWLGLGLWSKIIYAAVSAFFPIVYNAVRAFRSVDARYLRVGRAFGATSLQIDCLIKFRAGLPVAGAGLRIGAAVSFITVIIAEMLSSENGLGYLLTRSSQTFESSVTFAVILFVLILTGLIQLLIKSALPAGHVESAVTRQRSRRKTGV